jgi:DNA polymerase-3 subunit alpha
MKYLKMACGCTFPIVEDGPHRPYVKISFDVEDHDFECRATWDLLSSGDTKGVFQLESQLGQMLSKRLKPESIEQLSALTAIMRPGCMESIRDGKSVTDHYIDRKNANETVSYYHPALEPALKKTFGELIYQEQAMQIARDVAGFDLQEADVLRKAIGKKNTQLMAEVKQNFIKKAQEKGVLTNEQAEEVFSWIEKSQRYSFNKSHAVAYGVLAYLTAYAKAHLPEQFFTSYLRHSEKTADQSQEVLELVNNTKLLNIEVRPPDIRKLNKHFALKDVIYVGLIDIKGIGESVYSKIEDQLRRSDIDTWTKNQFLFQVAPKIGFTPCESLIAAGALSHLCSNRTLMIYELQRIKELTDKELDFAVANLIHKHESVASVFKAMIDLPVGRGQAIANKKRHEKVVGLYNSLINPSYTLQDNAVWIAKKEKELLGIALTCSEVDDCDTSAANCTCKDFINGYNKTPLIAAKIERIKEITIKNGASRGQKMCFLSISDSTCSLDSVTLFAEPYAKYKHLLLEGNTVMIGGRRDQKRGGLIVDRVWQLY